MLHTLIRIISSQAQFIKTCPTTNPALPVTPLPAFSISPATPRPSHTVSLNFTLPSSQSQDGLYVAWFNGLDVMHTAVQFNGNKASTMVPKGLVGTTYAGMVMGGDKANQTLVTGLSIVEFGV